MPRSVRKTGTDTENTKTILEFALQDQYGGGTAKTVSVDMTEHLNQTTIIGVTGDIKEGKNMKFAVAPGTEGNNTATVNLKDDINLTSVTVGDQTAAQTNKAVLSYDATEGASLTIADSAANKQTKVTTNFCMPCDALRVRMNGLSSMPRDRLYSFSDL